MFKSNLKLSLCRTCLVSVSQNNAFNIFNILGLAKKLMVSSGMMVDSTDEYPENVCSKCYEHILLLYEFQQMCVKSLNTYNELLKRHEKKKLLNVNLELLNHLTEKSIEPSDEVDILKELTDKEKRGKPLKKKMEDQKLERSRSVIRKTNDTGALKDDMAEDLAEYLQFDNESRVILQIERISSNKGSSPNEHAYKKIEVEEIELPDLCADNDECNKQEVMEEKSFTDTESCSSSQEPTSAQKQNHQCDRCSKSFNTRHKLQAHLKQHDGFTPYTCTFEGFKCDLENCERVYKNKSALNVHKRKCHNFGPELKTHMCEICGKVFKSSSVLNDHRYTHIDKTQLPYACEEEGCAKRFSNKEKLKVHKMRHAGIKNFMCPHCGMRKTTRNELKIHVNYHTLERTWPCRFCPKICNSAGNLKMHVKNMHERAKDFACRYCERTFAKADTKKYHEMTHTGEKPHECKECGRRFLQPAALRTHRKIHLRQKEILGANGKQKVTIVTEEVKNVMEETIGADVETESSVAEILCDTNESLD